MMKGGELRDGGIESKNFGKCVFKIDKNACGIIEVTVACYPHSKTSISIYDIVETCSQIYKQVDVMKRKTGNKYVNTAIGFEVPVDFGWQDLSRRMDKYSYFEGDELSIRDVPSNDALKILFVIKNCQL